MTERSSELVAIADLLAILCDRADTLKRQIATGPVMESDLNRHVAGLDDLACRMRQCLRYLRGE